MSSVPRHVVHRGSLLASGFWVSGTDSPDVERRVLALCDPGADVRRWLEGYVVLLGTPRRVSADLGAATPLARHGQWLSSAPLRPQELAALPASSNLALVIDGRIETVDRTVLERVDPAAWLALDAFLLNKTKHLGKPAPPRAALSAPVKSATLFDESVGRTAEQAEQQAELAQALAAPPHASSERARHAQRLRARAKRLLQSVASWLLRPGSGGTADSSRALSRVTRGKPSFWDRIKASLAMWIAQSRWGAYLGRKQAEYLRELLEKLAEHDDDEVLRRAIPLAQPGKGSSTPALSVPTPRTSFRIALGPKFAAPSIGLGGDLFSHLRRAYEAVFQRLDAAGQCEKAAYFLAEIMGESERAVTYLERHDKLRLAAQLAEARGLPAGLVVRQWFLAGEQGRAVAIAVREGAFADAIVRLERAGQKHEAGALRLLQAERLAQAGLLVKAAEVAAADQSGVALALRWLELARAAGDVRGVALELLLEPQRFEAVRAALLPFLASGVDPDQLPTILHVAEELVRFSVEASKPLARELGRELIALASGSGSPHVAATAARVASFVGGAFKADQPTVATFETKAGGPRRRYDYGSNDAGCAPVRDVHRFGSQLLLALGEAGVVMLNRHGKRLAHFDVPADTLVASSDGSRLLGVMRRRDRLEVARLDLATRRCERAFDLEAVSFARQFDGQTWLVCTAADQNRGEGKLLQLDVLEAEPRVMLSAPMPLHAPSLAFDGKQLNVVGSEPLGPLERLRYELSPLTLRQRAALFDVAANFFSGAAAATGNSVPALYERWNTDYREEAEARTKISFGDRTVTLPDGDLRGRASLDLHDDFYALAVSSSERTRILVGSRAASEPGVDVCLHGATSSALRLYGDLVLIGDERGRVLGFDLRRFGPIFDLRI